jgi:hypothetical protein
LASTGLGPLLCQAALHWTTASSRSVLGRVTVVLEAFGFVAVAVVIVRILSSSTHRNAHGTPEGKG